MQVALKAYSIQAIETPMFDKLLVMLGLFHVELAFYGALGTFINDSGMEYILTEANILAERTSRKLPANISFAHYR
jgi:predicted glycosyl hydrolase (DUF1957 family)